MEELALYKQNGPSDHSATLRDVLAIVFRHRRLIALSFLGIFSGAILTAVLQRDTYEAGMEILVKRDRVDPIVTPEAVAAPRPTTEVSEEELNSEVELLKSRELLEKVVIECKLTDQKHRSRFGIFNYILSGGFVNLRAEKPVSVNRFPQDPSGAASDFTRTFPIANVNPGADLRPHNPSENLTLVGASAPASSETIPGAVTVYPTARIPEEEVRIAVAVRALEKELKVGVVKKTDLISVNYASQDPQLAASVLTALGNFYLQKHVSVHRPPGAFDFFQQETRKDREELTKAEGRLAEFNRDAAVVAASTEKELGLQRAADLDVTLRQTEAAVAEAQQRIRILEQQTVSTPTRMVTQVRNADDGALLSQLRSNLLALEQKRTELLGKFEPGYRLVQEVDGQIAQTRAALTSAEKSKLHEETTDRDPTYEWARAELAKARADLVGLEARAQVTASSLQSYRENVRSLGQKQIVEDDLIRSVKAAEESYSLSLRKQEEARLSDALDRGRFLNVAIAEPPSVPALPSNRRSLTVLIGILLAILTSAGLAFVAERLDSTFRTPDEVLSLLDVPVLAALPQHGNGVATKFFDFVEQPLDKS